MRCIGVFVLSILAFIATIGVLIGGLALLSQCTASNNSVQVVAVSDDARGAGVSSRLLHFLLPVGGKCGRR